MNLPPSWGSCETDWCGNWCNRERKCDGFDELQRQILWLFLARIIGKTWSLFVCVWETEDHREWTNWLTGYFLFMELRFLDAVSTYRRIVVTNVISLSWGKHRTTPHHRPQLWRIALIGINLQEVRKVRKTKWGDCQWNEAEAKRVLVFWDSDLAEFSHLAICCT